jgi:hypothetical protein
MKIALTLAAGLLAASSTAFAADNNNGGKNDGGKNDQDKTGSISDPSRPDMDDQKACKDGTGGGAVCNEKGTTTDMQ